MGSVWSSTIYEAMSLQLGLCRGKDYFSTPLAAIYEWKRRVLYYGNTLNQHYNLLQSSFIILQINRLNQWMHKNSVVILSCEVNMQMSCEQHVI